jgi:hypothetical protein
MITWPDYGLLSEELVSFLQEHRALWDCHLSDVIINDTWKAVPESWLRALSTLSPAALLAALGGQVPHAWPSDLQAWIARARELSTITAQGKASEGCTCLKALSLDGTLAHARCSTTACRDRAATPTTAAAPQQCAPQSTPVRAPSMYKGVSEKKQHELEALASLVAALSRDVGADVVVDLGECCGRVAHMQPWHPVHMVPASGSQDRTHSVKRPLVPVT